MAEHRPTCTHRGPTLILAANLYLALIILTLAGSIALQPILGIGGNLWVNELAYMLLPAILLAWRGRWPWRETYGFRPARARDILAGIIAAAGLWFFCSACAIGTETLLTRLLGPSPDAGSMASAPPPLGQIELLIVAMIILAPICEETFFRGLLQGAYRTQGEPQGWINISVLFGVYHVLNGVSNALPATAIGLALGYAAHRTGSIWPGIFMHTINNILALFVPVLAPGLITGAREGGILSSLYLAGAVGLGVALLALSRLGRPSSKPIARARGDGALDGNGLNGGLNGPRPRPQDIDELEAHRTENFELAETEPAGIDPAVAHSAEMGPAETGPAAAHSADDDPVQVRPIKTRSIWRSAPIIGAMLILAAIGSSEIAMRVGAIGGGPRAGGQAEQRMSMSAEKLDGSLQMAVIPVSETEASASVITFQYRLQADECNSILALLSPDGSTAWQTEYLGTELTVKNPGISVDAAVPGEWRLVISGMAENLKVEASWSVTQR